MIFVVDRGDRPPPALHPRGGMSRIPRAMDLTICIPAFNEIEMTLDCLSTIPEAGEGLRVQTLLVDNGSSDGTAERVKSAYPDVEVIRNETNLGFAAAVNRGLEKASAGMILILNNDTRLLPGSLKLLTTYIGENPGVGMVGPRLIDEKGKTRNSIANFPTLTEIFVGKWLLRIAFPGQYPGKRTEFKVPTEVESLVGAAMMVRREMVDAVGRLDERFFFFLEETDLCRRASKAGWKVVYHPGVQVVHHQGGSARRYDTRKSIEYLRSLFLYFHKSQRGKWLVLRVLYPVKNLLEVAFSGLGVLLSAGFSAKALRRFQKKGATLWWQIRGYPEGAGLRREK